MNEDRGRVLLSGFNLEPAEKAICENVIKSHVSKIKERADFEYIKIRLRKVAKGKNFLHEIQAELKAGNKIFSSKTADYNLFSGIAEAIEKLTNELVHKLRTSRQKFK